MHPVLIQIGRIGCFMNGDAHGFPTDLPWGIVFSPESPASHIFPGMPLHPTQLYEIITNFVGFVLLWRLRKTFKTDGILFLVYVIYYGATRTVIEFFRADRLTYLNGVSIAQTIGVVGIITAAALIAYRSAQSKPAGSSR